MPNSIVDVIQAIIVLTVVIVNEAVTRQMNLRTTQRTAAVLGRTERDADPGGSDRVTTTTDLAPPPIEPVAGGASTDATPALQPRR